MTMLRSIYRIFFLWIHDEDTLWGEEAMDQNFQFLMLKRCLLAILFESLSRMIIGKRRRKEEKEVIPANFYTVSVSSLFFLPILQSFLTFIRLHFLSLFLMNIERAHPFRIPILALILFQSRRL